MSSKLFLQRSARVRDATDRSSQRPALTKMAELLGVESAMHQRCRELLASLHATGAGETAAAAAVEGDALREAERHQRVLLSELLALQRSSKQCAQQHQQAAAHPMQEPASTSDAAAAAAAAAQGTHASVSGVEQREQVLQALRVQLDSHVLSLASAVSKSSALLKEFKSMVQPQPPAPSPQDILAFAHQLRYTTFAHAGLVSQPPAPQQAQMLNSTLFHYSQQRAADAMPTALTGTATAGAKPEPPPQAQPQLQPQQAQAQAQAADAAASTLPLSLHNLPPMPAGWKPGDPLPEFPAGFQLPDNTPAMPPGWQPGDAVTLPADQVGTGVRPMDIDGAAAAAGPSERQPAAVDQTAAAARPAQPAVKPELLSFILNPDLEVADDDYSSAEDEDSDEF